MHASGQTDTDMLITILHIPTRGEVNITIRHILNGFSTTVP